MEVLLSRDAVYHVFVERQYQNGSEHYICESRIEAEALVNKYLDNSEVDGLTVILGVEQQIKAVEKITQYMLE